MATEKIKKDMENKKSLSPKQIVLELDRFIVGQDAAKKAVAIALRNRYRRKQVPESIKEEIVPKNILMVGPTGVGKTEIARRLAKLTNAPFIKVEATKFTEVGYVGRDVDSIIRDLVDISINILKNKAKNDVKNSAKIHAIEKILDIVAGINSSEETRNKFREKLHKGELDNIEIEIEVADNPPPSAGAFDIPGMPGASMGILNVGDILGKAFGHKKSKQKKVLVKEAIEIIVQEESEKLIDEEKIIKNALLAAEEDGIVFLDEIDKICSRSDSSGGSRSEISREGVQRDLLPLIEGTTITTKYGQIKTDHILFIGSGAFHVSKPSDLLPELQGRLPIRVELKALSKDDMIKILTEPENSLIKQYVALIRTEGVELKFDDTGIEEIASITTRFNKEIENIGARRLHTILEKLLEDVSFRADEMSGEIVVINREFVQKQLADISTNTDLSKFIL